MFVIRSTARREKNKALTGEGKPFCVFVIRSTARREKNKALTGEGKPFFVSLSV